MITIANGKLQVNNVIIDDRDIVQFFSEIKADDDVDIETVYIEVLVRALKIGTVAIQRAQTQVDIDVIRREFEQLHQQVEITLDAIFSKDGGKLDTALTGYLGKDGKLHNLLEDTITGENSNFAHMLDYTDGQSPLKKLYDAIEKKFKIVDDRIIEVQRQLAEQKGRNLERDRGTQQGFEFEIVLEQILDDLSKPYKDIVSLVGTEIAGGHSKKGDLLIEINKNDTDGKKASILIEAKREASKPIRGRTGILTEITNAKITRQADFAIAVFSEDACPAEVGQLRDYGGNRLVCSIPADGRNPLALEIAYLLARTELCWQMRHVSGGFNRVKVKQVLIDIKDKLKNIQSIKSKATTLLITAGEIRSELDNMEKEIKELVSATLRELENADTNL
jgi:hypothetical protein